MTESTSLSSAAERVVDAATTLSDELEAIRAAIDDGGGPGPWGGGVTHVYNPLVYARAPALNYLRTYAAQPVRMMWMGMNPGPWGMAQTGVPFGAIPAARDFLGVQGEVGQPANPHPKRPVEGFACPKVEVSGTRLWGFVEAEFGNATAMRGQLFVWNYCPLTFMADTGRNITPNKLAAAAEAAIEARCDAAVRKVVAAVRPTWIVGVGVYAEKRLATALRATGRGKQRRAPMPDGDGEVRIGRILHPSPASPKANRGWAAAARAELEALGTPLAPAKPAG